MGNVWTIPASVVRVVDGDTVALRLDLGFHLYMDANCRVAGIDCPEMGTPEGRAAKAFTAGLLTPGMAVTFVSRKLDKYGRPLGSVLLVPGGADLATALLAAGHATPLTY